MRLPNGLSECNKNLILTAVACLGFASSFIWNLGPAKGGQIDFFINYTGVNLAWSQITPYDLATIRQKVSAEFPPHAGEPALECGFFLPPQSFLVLKPWTVLPWEPARWFWIAFSGIGALSVPLLIYNLHRPRNPHRMGWGFVILAILMNPLCLRAVSLGQAGFFIVFFVVTGHLARERGWKLLAVALWSCCALKPQIGIALIAFACFQSGARFAASIVLAIAIWTVLGASLLGNPIRVILEYVDHLARSHKAIGFNRVTNDQLTSWNRAVAALGGPHFELGAIHTLIGQALAGILLWSLRVRHQRRPSIAWALAATVAWIPVVTPILAYDLVIWVLMIPYLYQLADNSRRKDLYFLISMILLISIPRGAVLTLARECPELLPVFLSYRTFAAIGASMYFLFVRPATFTNSSEFSTPAGIESGGSMAV